MAKRELPEINVAKAHAVWQGGECSEIKTPDGHTLYIDSPGYAGGTPKGPAPTGMMICAYAGATNMLLKRITEGMGVTIHSLDVEARGAYSPRGIAGQEGYHPRFTEIELEVTLRSDATSDQIEEIKAGRQRRCPAYGVLSASGATMKEKWNVSS
jgi:uncharacterized OsmC-like protein